MPPPATIVQNLHGSKGAVDTWRREFFVVFDTRALPLRRDPEHLEVAGHP
jgi:hypothetical protein